MPKTCERVWLKAGDTLWFCGRGVDSRAIAIWTTSLKQKFRGQLISHVGLIAKRGNEFKHFESTTFNDAACDAARRKIWGVQCNDPWDRIDNYDGRVYLGRLVYPLRPRQSARLTEFCEGALGRPYDYKQAVLAGTRWIKHYLSVPDESLLFCDELVGMGLMRAGVAKGFNPSAETPASLARRLVNWWVMKPLQRLK